MAPLTYLQFLAAFLVPAIVVLAGGVAVGGPRRRAVRLPAVGFVLVLALGYTVPWDNYLVGRGTWTYGDGVVAARVWHAPVGEYAFVVLAALLAAVWLALLAARPADVEVSVRRWDRVVGVAGALVLGLVGVVALSGSGTYYLGAILTWAAPVLGLQWAVGWPYLWARRRTVALGVLVPAAYLSAVDAVAIGEGLWRLNPAATTGVRLGGLPVEEAAFFLLTSVLVVQGLVLYPWVVDGWE